MLKRQATGKLNGEQLNQNLIRTDLISVTGNATVDLRRSPYAKHFSGYKFDFEVINLAIEAKPSTATLDLGDVTTNLNAVLSAVYPGSVGNNVTMTTVGDSDPQIQAEYALGESLDSVTTVIEASSNYPGVAGNVITLVLSATGAGTGSGGAVGTVVTFNFEDGVTTAANFEAFLAGFGPGDAVIVTKTTGTGTFVTADAGTYGLVDGQDGEGVTVDVVDTDITVHFVGNVSTVGDFVTALASNDAAMRLIKITDPGTAENVLDASDDAIEDEPFVGGSDDDATSGQRLSCLKNQNGTFTVFVERMSYSGDDVIWIPSVAPVSVRWTALLV